MIGVAAWIASEDSPGSGLTPQVLTVIGVLGAFSIGLVALGYARRKATLTPFGDGLVFGIAILFDCIRLVSAGFR